MTPPFSGKLWSVEEADKILAHYERERMARPGIAFQYKNQRLLASYENILVGEDLDSRRIRIDAASKRAQRIRAAITLTLFRSTHFEKRELPHGTSHSNLDFPYDMIRSQFLGNYGKPWLSNCGSQWHGSIEEEIFNQFKAGGVSERALSIIEAKIKASSLRANALAAPQNLEIFQTKQWGPHKLMADNIREQFAAGGLEIGSDVTRKIEEALASAEARSQRFADDARTHMMARSASKLLEKQA